MPGAELSGQPVGVQAGVGGVRLLAPNVNLPLGEQSASAGQQSSQPVQNIPNLFNLADGQSGVSSKLY